MSDSFNPSSNIPQIDKTSKHIKLFQGKSVLADTIRPVAIIEKYHSIVYYLPPENVNMAFLRKNGNSSECRWKGKAVYYDLSDGENVINNAAWSYPKPKEGYEDIEDYIAFAEDKIDSFYINGELVNPGMNPANEKERQGNFFNPGQNPSFSNN